MWRGANQVTSMQPATEQVILIGDQGISKKRRDKNKSGVLGLSNKIFLSDGRTHEKRRMVFNIENKPESSLKYFISTNAKRTSAKRWICLKIKELVSRAGPWVKQS